MSQDEILFDEVRYREPARMRRPDRDRRWACVAYEVPGADDLPVFLDRATADAIERHALRDTSVELGGILLGKECVDDQTGAPFVWVTKSLEAKHYENTQASFTYTHDSWEEITRERDRLHPDLDIVGWYHTHPDFGVFLSSHDLFIQHNFFGQPLQLAYVVDPVRQTRGFFQWRQGSMAQTGGFYLTADRGDRLALARLVNDLENLPNADGGGGGGLSPRLEAELIAMLTRPTTHHAAPSAADRAQTATLFALLGAMLGVLGLAAALWLNALGGHVQQQTRALDDLRKTLTETADAQRVALDAVAGETAGTARDRFVERYARATRERDEARLQLDHQRVNNDLLLARTKQLTDELARTKADLADSSKRADQYEKDAKEVAELRARFETARATNERQAERLAEMDDLLDTAQGRQAAALSRRYRTAWYAAVAGWSVSLLLLLGLIGVYAYLRFPPEEEPSPAPGNEPPTHRIV